MRRKRSHYLLILIPVILIGLASRKMAFFPPFLAAYSGDTLWALMVYLLLGMLRPSAPIWQQAGVALAFSFGIEVSQLVQTDWLNAIRHTTLGGLVLGFGFLWSDLICYTVGVLMGVALEWFWLLRHKAIPNADLNR